MEKLRHKNKGDKYYNSVKKRFVAIIPEGSNIILDIGCATGSLGRKLRELKKVKEIVGVEVFPAAGEEAAKYYTQVYIGDIEEMVLPYKNYFDFVVCGDIIEHLKDPWMIMRNIRIWLKDGGMLICSVPNIRYWRILRDLVVLGKWNYVEAGILDNSHLRFFTRCTFIELLKRAEFNVVYQEMWVGGTKQEFVNRITCEIFEEFLGAQFMVVAKKRQQREKEL